MYKFSEDGHGTTVDYHWQATCIDIDLEVFLLVKFRGGGEGVGFYSGSRRMSGEASLDLSVQIRKTLELIFGADELER